MSLLRRMEEARPPSETRPPTRTPPTAAATKAERLRSGTESLRDLKVRLQERVMRSLDSGLTLSDPKVVRRHVEGVIERIFDEEGLALTRSERVRLAEAVTDEIVGLGPIEPLVRDETITEVMVNGPRQIYVERAGRLERVDVTFVNDEHVMRIIDRIIAPIGRRIDESSPRVDARLSDGSRVNAIIPPLSLVGPVITIRKFSAHPFTVDDLISFGTATPEMFDFLKACVVGRLNMFVSGGTGSGKTTTLNVLSSFIPDDERIVTIEDAAELQLRQRHVITLEARPPNLEGRGEISIRDLLRNSLHMRPDRIIVGECRAGEALDMLQAMNTGQDGSLSTGHANTPADMLRRLETMVLMTGYELPLRAVREQMSAAVDLIVHTARLKDGSRKIVTITEVLGMDGDQIVTQDIFDWEQTGVQDGRVMGVMRPTGVRPGFVRKLRANGIELPPEMFGLEQFDDDDDATAASVLGGQGGYPQPVAAGGMVYLTGVGPVDPQSRRVVGETIQAQTRQVLENLRSLLASAGSSLEDIVWVTWGLRSMSEFDGFIEAWNGWFGEDAPGRHGTLVPVPQRQGEFRISVSAIARAGAGVPAMHATERQFEAGAFVKPTPTRTPGPR